jgi:hypothetical protein
VKVAAESGATALVGNHAEVMACHFSVVQNCMAAAKLRAAGK